jgi:deoxyribodipyrimidine photo-lyase
VQVGLMMKNITIVWFRQDLRLSDNPALFSAASSGPILPLYILDDESPGSFKMGQASRWWLHHSLKSLDASLDHNLNLYIGNPKEILKKLINRHAIKAVYWNRGYEPWQIELTKTIKAYLVQQGIEAKSFNGSLLWEPHEVVKQDGTAYKVFTPFYNRVVALADELSMPLKKPTKLLCIKDSQGLKLTDLKLMPKIKWYKTMENTWDIGEQAAKKKLLHFLHHGIAGYKSGRDMPHQDHASRLSPHLHFGEISPRQVWFKAKEIPKTGIGHDIEHFLRELVWREFSYYLLYYFPDLPTANYQKKFDNFPWLDAPKLLRAWQQGKTGYPLVDAGMRELWQTGYMHNRVRMVVASFLIKNLLIHWHEGERWFFDCLVDADLANNSASWQWVAGSGTDAAPYFRIFNPITQGEKFDTDGKYTKRYVPELANLPPKYLFKPWEAPKEVLSKAGIVLGTTYPRPIVDIPFSRERALDAFQGLKNI